jgi:hypothetical protein
MGLTRSILYAQTPGIPLNGGQLRAGFITHSQHYIAAFNSDKCDVYLFALHII